MPRVIGIDPGTVSLDVLGLDDGRLVLDASWPTAGITADPTPLLQALRAGGPVDLVAGPSGYGLPLVPAAAASEDDLRLAVLAAPGEGGGIGGLRRLARALADTGIPMVFLPGVIHLDSVPAHRKLNRVDLGTADKLCAAALGIATQAGRLGIAPAEASFILLELGGAFTAALAVDRGRIVDGIGGTSGPIGWRAGGAWDGEVAFLAGAVDKAMLFAGGAEDAAARFGRDVADEAYLEGAVRTALALTAAVARPREILVSGRHADRLIPGLAPRLAHVAPVVRLRGRATTAKEGAEGAAILADGLCGGSHAPLVDALGLRACRGTVLDHLLVVPPARARQRLGLAVA